MTSTTGITANSERFETACANLTGALERFADLAKQIARDFRATTEIARTAAARPHSPAV